MAHERIISDSRGIEGGGLPLISQSLDSVRAYQFEIHFDLGGLQLGADSDKLTLAAKQVGQMGFASEDIEVHRINDKVFYPGKASPEALTVTFDNQYQTKVSEALWKWYKTIYDPTTGTMSNGADINVFKAQKATVIHLNARGTPLYETVLYGVYPKSWKTAEFNYGTNEFHTIEVEFRYDFMDHGDSK
tara:strand:- start:265 stop:831 length:567 start_codon:yes stop_codon:yes gene_type:complete